MRQELMWMPPGEDQGGMVNKVPLVPYPFETWPLRIWTLYTETDPDTPPILPYNPMHLRNAFMEDRMHDWIIRERGSEQFFDYSSRVVDGAVWVLLEWEE